MRFVPLSPFKVGDKVRYKNGKLVGKVSDIQTYSQGDRAAHKHVLCITVRISPTGGSSMFYIHEDEDESKQLELDEE
ncbi:MAG: hypothetical protein M1352_01600 [Patescibacteria group bacterium]|nr:hypothetical protein [Patescibacteria group bacterium]